MQTSCSKTLTSTKPTTTQNPTKQTKKKPTPHPKKIRNPKITQSRKITTNPKTTTNPTITSQGQDPLQKELLDQLPNRYQIIITDHTIHRLLQLFHPTTHDHTQTNLKHHQKIIDNISYYNNTPCKNPIYISKQPKHLHLTTTKYMDVYHHINTLTITQQHRKKKMDHI